MAVISSKMGELMATPSWINGLFAAYDNTFVSYYDPLSDDWIREVLVTLLKRVAGMDLRGVGL